MAVLLEIVGYVLLEVVAYGTGRVFAQVLIPRVGIERFERQRSAPAWNWRGFTYVKGDRRFFYTESLQLIGIGVWLAGGLLVLAALRWGGDNAA